MAIRQKKNGKYIADVRDEFGKKFIRTFDKQSEAKAFERKHENKKYENRLINAELKPKRFLIETELEHFEKTKERLSKKSIDKYRYVIEQIRLFAQGIGVVYVDEFTPDHGTLFKEEIMRERKDPKGSTDRVFKAKPKTINFYLTTIRAFFQLEYVKGHIKRSPMLHVKNVQVEKKKADYFTISELKSFFAQDMHQAYCHAFMGFLLTGMRFSELANLRWIDVNFEAGTIHVQSHDGFVTKTHYSERIIPIGADLLKLLLLRLELNGDSGYVFKSPNGKILRERSLLGKCKAIAEKAGIISRATIHKFRHTYATMLIHKDVPIQNIKELLGHSSIVQTEIYAHNKADHLHKDVFKLDKLLE